jgi:hypothetical protein
MGKPSVGVYNSFVKEFEKINKNLGLKQYIVPYLMSSHPGSKMKDAIIMAEYLNTLNYMPEQVQDFYPTPGTVSTCMYYTGIDPLTLEEVYVERDPHKKAMQRALIQFKNPENYDLVKEALLMEHREDLIGFGPECLIPPRKMQKAAYNGKSKGSRANSEAALRFAKDNSKSDKDKFERKPKKRVVVNKNAVRHGKIKKK